MLKIKLIRTSTSDHGTFGVLIAPGFSCKTIELPWRDNARNISCIPSGEYQVRWTWSRAFKRFMYLVGGVPDRSGIRIHSGNFAGDRSKGFKSHSYGCILPGKYKGILSDQRAILCSRFALNDFENAMDRRDFDIEIKGEF